MKLSETDAAKAHFLVLIEPATVTLTICELKLTGTEVLVTAESDWPVPGFAGSTSCKGTGVAAVASAAVAASSTWVAPSTIT